MPLLTNPWPSGQLTLTPDPRVEKIDELIAAVRADPFEKGQGKPEPLRHEITQTCQDMFTDPIGAIVPEMS